MSWKIYGVTNLWFRLFPTAVEKEVNKTNIKREEKYADNIFSD